MKNRKHWTYAALALAGGIIGGAVSSQLLPAEGLALASARAAREIRAERFVLVGHDGTQRGIIQVNQRGYAEIALQDGLGRTRTEMRVSTDGTGAFGFFDANGAKRVIVGETPSGRDGIALYSTAGRQLASFSVAEDNQSSVTLYDPNNGRARVGLGVASNGEPALVLFDQYGRDRAEMHVNVNGDPGLALANASGKTIAGLPVEQAQQSQQ